MDSLNRIFASINEAKNAKKKSGKGKGKARIPSHHEKKGGQKSPLGSANPYDHDHKQKAGKKVNASTEIANILNLIKEAYQEELISEEAFLAIADPIMRSLMNEVKYEGTPKTGTVTAGPKGRTKELTGEKAARVHAAVKRRVSSEFGPEAANPPEGSKLYYGKNPQPPKKPQPPKNRERARGSFHRRIRRPRG
jgi:hypothetical protein